MTRRYLPIEIANDLKGLIQALQPSNKRTRDGLEITYRGKKIALRLEQGAVVTSKVARFR